MAASDSDTDEKRSVWNHRVIRHRHVSGWDEPYFYVVHEVHYEIDGDAQEIVAWSVEGRAPQGNTLEELREDLELYLAALAKPVLEEVPGAGGDDDVPVLREVDDVAEGEDTA